MSGVQGEVGAGGRRVGHWSLPGCGQQGQQADRRRGPESRQDAKARGGKQNQNGAALGTEPEAAAWPPSPAV